MTTEPGTDPLVGRTRYDTDPEALAWARGHVRAVGAKYRKFERDARERGDLAKASQWRKFANLLDMELAGGKTCAITPFDERKPGLAALLGEGNPDGT